MAGGWKQPRRDPLTTGAFFCLHNSSNKPLFFKRRRESCAHKLPSSASRTRPHNASASRIKALFCSFLTPRTLRMSLECIRSKPANRTASCLSSPSTKTVTSCLLPWAFLCTACAVAVTVIVTYACELPNVSKNMLRESLARFTSSSIYACRYAYLARCHFTLPLRLRCSIISS